MASRVVHFEIQAKDLERAKKFYSETFGWKMDQMGPEMSNYVVITTGDPKEPGGINGGMVQMDNKTWNAYSCVISVDDIKKAIEDVKAAGGQVIDGPMDIPTVGQYAVCKDTEDNFFTLLQPSPDMTAEKS